MAEEIVATPSWVEEHFDEIWARFNLPAMSAITASRSAYLACLATCTGATNHEECHDSCREDFLTALHKANVGDDTLAALKAELEGLEAEITERT